MCLLLSVVYEISIFTGRMCIVYMRDNFDDSCRIGATHKTHGVKFGME